MRIVDGHDNSYVMISVGYSIINQSATVNVGSLMLKYGGGGHRHVGACQIRNDHVDRAIEEILSVIR
jgi:nanoRNase/pAp phosphatase (c-di-AMP/oligoRNAs hydrolase)